MRGLLLLGLALLAGCGVYEVGYHSAIPGHEIAVPIFVNKTLRRGYEDILTQAVRDRILDATPLQLAREGSAGAILKGTIVSVNQSVVIPNVVDTAPPVESTVSITASVEVVDRSGKLIVGGAGLDDRPGGPAYLTESEHFVPTFAQNVDTAADRAMKKLAERIVDLLESGWGGGQERQ